MIDTQIKTKLYESIELGNKEHTYENWHVSALASCPRSHYFKRLQIPPINKPGAGKILRWSAGHNMEEAIREHVENVFPDVKSNVRLLDTKNDLTGEYDNLSGQTLIEIKTVHDYAFKESKDGLVGLKEQVGVHPNGNKKWDMKQHAYLHHVMQNHGYAMMLRDEVEVTEIIFIYISLSGRMCIYREPIEQVHFDEINRRLDILNKAWESKTPPDCMCQEKNNPLWATTMQWCDYRNGDDCCNLNLTEGV
jgi:hypothetical protein